MSYVFKLLGQKAYRYILQAFHVIPVKKNRILFTSFGGKNYTDNPRYVYNYMREHNCDCEFAWAFKHPENFKGNKELAGCKILKSRSFEWYLYMLTSKVIVLNDRMKAYLPIRSEQCLINTWHGGGTFKKSALAHGEANTYEKWVYKRQADNTKAFVSSSRVFTELVINNSFDYHGFVLETGMPRNAVLMSDHDSINRKVREYFSIPLDNLVVLYAPTFREFNEDISETDRLDIERCKFVFEKKYKRKVSILYRAHYHMANNSHGDMYLDATKYHDMQELLCAADVLITDYSSSMWDFSLMKKPVFLYAHDLDEYVDKQGFYWDISRWPYPYSKNMDEFERIVENFDQEKYSFAVDKYFADTESYESENSLKDVVSYINRQMSNG